MGRQGNRILTAAMVCGVAATCGAASGYAQQPARPTRQTIIPEGQTVKLMRGTITGTVVDDRGGPLAGAVVSAVGATMAMTVSDARGYFALDSLPIGEYILQAHRTGFTGSVRERVHVGPVNGAVLSFQLRKADLAVGTAGTTPPVSARPIMAAGFGLPATTLSDQPDSATEPESADHPHTETAWRLRHVKRSILKDSSGSAVEFDDVEDTDFRQGSALWRAVDTAANFATTVFGDLPFSGEVNLLTTGALEPGALFASGTVPRGVAYMSIGAPTGAGDWSVRAAMSEGDLASWIVAGSFASRTDGAHNYNMGLSYSTQEYAGANPSAITAVGDTNRNVGEMYAFDRWEIGSRLGVEYGARYAHYDYLEARNLLSPRVALSVEPMKDTRIVTTVAQRMVAPGAEEFLATNSPGPWLPPERTFAPLDGIGAEDGLRVERARMVGVALERSLTPTSTVSVERFVQSVDDQLVTLFGLGVPAGLDAAGHYYVASAGAVDADGWAFRLSSSGNKRIRGSVDYSITHTRWLSRGDAPKIANFAPTAVRSEEEDLHDVTTSLETAIPETSTRVVVVYKINTGYARSNATETGPGLDGRFDVQINQALPFDFGGTRWEVLVGVRNLFRDPTDPGSVYDELLVVKPPKRVVGGFLVRF